MYGIETMSNDIFKQGLVFKLKTLTHAAMKSLEKIVAHGAYNLI